MSIFDQNSPQENSEELLYQAIKEELKPILIEWDEKCGMLGNTGIPFMDPARTKMIKDTAKITLQFVWKKLGMKIPEYSRRILDDNNNILELKRGYKD